MMMLSVTLLVMLAAAVAADEDIIYDITEEEYYRMPQLFTLDEYEGCLARGHAFCVGSFELLPAHAPHTLYDTMQRYSRNWVFNFNHTRLHRGLCLHQSCAGAALRPPHLSDDEDDDALEAWFTYCVNSSMSSSYGLTARPLRLEYCHMEGAPAPPPAAAERALVAVLAALLALAALSTALDLMLPDHARKGKCWAVALCWSVRGCWRSLQAPVARGRTDLRALDGLRVFCMMVVILAHVSWLTTQTYIANTWQYETMRRAPEVLLMVNSTLVVQIFFLMSTFLLAHKLLEQRRRGDHIAPLYTFFDTMFNRIVRISPSYWLAVWAAAAWWSRSGSGPLWTPLVGSEAAVCRHKWWTHLLYLNNVVDADDKCLLQTWYLAADMQLYALSLILTLALLRLRRGALVVLGALMAAVIGAVFAQAYNWHLIPTYALHNPELVRAEYRGESSFNVIYQSPLSNAAGALTGLLLAHVHHALLDANIHLNQYKIFRWVSILSPPLAAWWAASSPQMMGAGPPHRGAAATLAAVERPIFAILVALGLLGAMHDVKSPLRTLFSWRMWATPARLSFGVLLLHLPLNKAYIAVRQVPSQLTRQIALLEWCGVALVSYACALPLALLVELPAQRLLRALRPPTPPIARAKEAHPPVLQEKTDAD